MKLAYLANIRFPSERAHATQIAHMCQSFVEVGAEVDLFINKRRVDPSSSLSEIYGFVPSFSVTHLSPRFFFPTIRWTFYVAEFVFALSFLMVAGHKKFERIYSRGEWVLYFLSFFVPPEKLVWESHEAKITYPARVLLRNGVKTIVISDGIFDQYVSQGVSKNQMCVAYDGIDESFFRLVQSKGEVRNQLKVAQEQSVVMYIGGLDTWKGIGTFCEASKYTEGKIKFVVIGGSTDETLLLKEAYPNVDFLGALPYKDLKNNQQAADILVVPNTAKTDLSSKYTSPLKLFAHMTSGVPLIVSAVPSLVSVTGKELVTTFTPDDPRALADAVKAVFANLSQKKKNAEELKILSKQYTWTNRGRRIVDFVS